jgi:uncharacterized protein (TIGR03435 family)
MSLMSLIRQSYLTFANGAMSLSREKMIPMEKNPGWIESDSYTIQAKAAGLDPGQGVMLGPMMQALLKDRFRVKVPRETREPPEYALVVMGEGPRLRSAAAGDCVRQDLDHPWARAADSACAAPQWRSCASLFRAGWTGRSWMEPLFQGFSIST